MKKIIAMLMTLVMVFAFTGCSADAGASGAENSGPADAGASNTENSITLDTDKSTTESVDLDLTLLSSTMVYSEVYNMMYEPDSYVGKIVRMNGQFVVYTNNDQSAFYPAVIIADATACCAQGIEFVLAGENNYPDDYPELDTIITVTGIFETYYEDGNMYCHLTDAVVEA